MLSEAAGPPSLLYLVKRLELVIRLRLDEMLRGSGVSTLQHNALSVLSLRDGLTAAHLARVSFVTPQSMADMLQVLEVRDLIRRARNPDNRRELLIFLTDSGRDFLDEHSMGVDAIITRMTSGLSADDVHAMRELLIRTWTALRDNSPK